MVRNDPRMKFTRIIVCRGISFSIPSQPIYPCVHGLLRQLLRLKCDATEENMEVEIPKPLNPSDDPSDDEGASKQGLTSDPGIVAPPPPPSGGAHHNADRAEGLSDHEAAAVMAIGGGSTAMPESFSAKRQRIDKDTKDDLANIVCERQQSEVKESRYDHVGLRVLNVA